jgi:sn-glycerol 3-phosphate transport system substrate-binding protein
MQYLNTPRNAADWHKSYGSAPVTNEAVKLLDDEGWFEQHPYFRTATEQLDMMTGPATQAVLGPYARIQRAAMEAIEDVLVRDAEPTARFTEATGQAQRLLDDYNSRCRGAGVHSSDCLLVDS